MKTILSFLGVLILMVPTLSAQTVALEVDYFGGNAENKMTYPMAPVVSNSAVKAEVNGVDFHGAVKIMPKFIASYRFQEGKYRGEEFASVYGNQSGKFPLQQETRSRYQEAAGYIATPVKRLQAIAGVAWMHEEFTSTFQAPDHLPSVVSSTFRTEFVGPVVGVGYTRDVSKRLALYAEGRYFPRLAMKNRFTMGTGGWDVEHSADGGEVQAGVTYELAKHVALHVAYRCRQLRADDVGSPGWPVKQKITQKGVLAGLVFVF